MTNKKDEYPWSLHMTLAGVAVEWREGTRDDCEALLRRWDPTAACTAQIGGPVGDDMVAWDYAGSVDGWVLSRGPWTDGEHRADLEHQRAESAALWDEFDRTEGEGDEPS